MVDSATIYEKGTLTFIRDVSDDKPHSKMAAAGSCAPVNKNKTGSHIN